mmetsp:Transcript_62940/g.167324  ORF Transcript_62940/g.167324 Transcript_62940/m.167324 type:complete len:321 (-) Transcript_62940:1687-2649(-)
MAWARTCFLTVMGWYVPPFTVASLATKSTSCPCTTPMPVTTPAEKTLPPYISYAASADNSRNSVPGSMMASILSRGSCLFRFLCWLTAFSPPPCLTLASRSLRMLSSSLLWTSLAWNESSFLSAGRVRHPTERPMHGLASSSPASHTSDPSAAAMPGAATLRAASVSTSTSCAAEAASPLSYTSASITISTSPASTVSSASTLIPRTVPPAGARISVSSFIAERTKRGSPSLTSSPSFTRTLTTEEPSSAHTLRSCLPMTARSLWGPASAGGFAEPAGAAGLGAALGAARDGDGPDLPWGSSCLTETLSSFTRNCSVRTF